MQIINIYGCILISHLFRAGSEHLTQVQCRCPEGWTCVELKESLAFDVPGVDNFAKATLSMFQCVTLSGWSYMQARLLSLRASSEQCAG
jgi:hypothetical protein